MATRPGCGPRSGLTRPSPGYDMHCESPGVPDPPPPPGFRDAHIRRSGKLSVKSVQKRATHSHPLLAVFKPAYQVWLM